jgi:hypothetical protein
LFKARVLVIQARSTVYLAFFWRLRTGLGKGTTPGGNQQQSQARNTRV